MGMWLMLISSDVICGAKKTSRRHIQAKFCISGIRIQLMKSSAKFPSALLVECLSPPPTSVIWFHGSKFPDPHNAAYYHFYRAKGEGGGAFFKLYLISPEKWARKWGPVQRFEMRRRDFPTLYSTNSGVPFADLGQRGAAPMEWNGDGIENNFPSDPKPIADSFSPFLAKFGESKYLPN